MKKPIFSKTKIVTTIGPSSDSKEQIIKMIQAGVDVYRFNMKHGEVSWLEEKMNLIRKTCKEMGHRVAILVDLQGQEIRSGYLKNGKLDIKKGEFVWFVSNQDLVYKSKEKLIVIDRPEAIKTFKKGHKILIDDGVLEFEVIDKKMVKGDLFVKAKVINGGVLKNRKGVNLPGICPDIPVLIKRDFDCLSVKNKKDIDYVGQSFVAKKEHVQELKKELKKRGIKAGVVAKIERREAVENFEEILAESDAIMVARGDLGVEIALHEVPFWQKHMIKRCREVGKPVITATQMLESMVENPIPTRAEISDVANAVYDGSDAIMLSGESSIGKYPVKAVTVMSKEARFIESKVNYPKVQTITEEMGQTMAVVMAGNELIECSYKGIFDLSAVVVLSETGKTARYLSKLRPRLPIIGITSNAKVCDRMKMLWGVKPYLFEYKKESEVSIRKILEFLKQEKEVIKGDKVVMIYGELWGKPGLTSVTRIQAVV
ncbi:MAG: pyruvate kinase [Patescibacteria group bacterium]|nr:pyruvate kinase [Patescibacteria group bacterium]